jgi:hypothetical protein
MPALTGSRQVKRSRGAERRRELSFGSEDRNAASATALDTSDCDGVLRGGQVDEKPSAGGFRPWWGV